MPYRYTREGRGYRSAADLLGGEIERETPEAAQQYLDRTVGATVSRAMPQFLAELQNIREGAIRRGITGGDLGTSYEGDLASAFQRNIADTTGGLAYDTYQTSRNRYLDLATGQRDYETAQANAKRRRRGGLGRFIGTAIGSFLGPFGAGVAGNLADRLLPSG